MKQRVSAIGAFFCGNQRALAPLDRAQLALKEQRLDDLVPVLRGNLRMVRCLRVSNRAQLMLDRLAVGVEAVAQPGADRLARLASPPEVIAQSLRSGLCHPPPQLADLFADLSVFTSVGLAIALEAAAVGEGEQGAAQFVGRKRAIQRLGAQLHRIAIAHRGALVLAVGQQVEIVQQVSDAPAAAQHAVAVAAWSALFAPHSGVRGAALRVASVLMNQDAAAD